MERATGYARWRPSDRDENDHQSITCWAASTGLRERGGRGMCGNNGPPMRRPRHGEIKREVEVGGLGRWIVEEKRDETDGDRE